MFYEIVVLNFFKKNSQENTCAGDTFEKVARMRIY